MGPLDSAAKVILREVPQDPAGPAPSLAGVAIRSARADDTVPPAFSLTMDKVLVLDVERGALCPCTWRSRPRGRRECPARSSATEPAHRVHDTLWLLVICLKPGKKQGEPRTTYERRVGERVALRFEFDVVKVWELRADDLLRDAKPGLLPLVPYADGTSKGHVERALEALGRIDPEHRRGELQAALTVFADNVFPDENWAARMPEELLMGSTIYQRGEAAGELAGKRTLLARQLAKRLAERAQPLLPRLQRADLTTLDTAADLLAERLSDDELLAQLDQALPNAD
ncbi:MAG: hypothetical protein R3F62_29800 [Planctomycetota bacterium]